ncbi:30S ribosomal protein S12 [Candidatus Woesearchaeota archaeon]|jgi:small subunit ribosomal protein S12|nr:30S ribosomal protein S12 [Candidatus Woesearchaeota archaeon]MBT7238311.1 30S ribosomal protein S12 [Candidatus Woesearchaeota archaeon]
MAKKGRGLGAGKKIAKTRATARWKNTTYKRRVLSLKKKSDPLKASPQGKAIVLSKTEIEAKQPNSALRKCVKCQLSKNGKKITAFVPGYNAIKFIDEHDEVVVECIGGAKGRSKGDLSGIRWQVIKVNDQALKSLLTGKVEKGRR